MTARQPITGSLARGFHASLADGLLDSVREPLPCLGAERQRSTLTSPEGADFVADQAIEILGGLDVVVSQSRCLN
jgi:hypothetical protein